MARQRNRSRTSDRTEEFDVTDADGGDAFDGPTELPPHWTPPPDPDFRTGVMPRIEHADLSVGVDPGFEPSDSMHATVRFSRVEMRDAIASRAQGQRARPAAARAQAARKPALPAPPPTDPPPRAIAEKPVPPRPRTTPPAPHAMQVGDPAIRLVIAYRWQVHHVATAFALGLLTGVVAMVIAVLAAE